VPTLEVDMGWLVWLVWLAVLLVLALLLVLLDRLPRRRRIGTRRAPEDRPSHEQPPPGGGFEPNQQSGRFGPWSP
jgi:hypothetical protein